MDQSRIITEIERLARNELDWEGELEPSMHLIKDLQLDSLRLLALAVQVEDFFQVRIEPQEGAEIRTIGDLADAIQRKL